MGDEVAVFGDGQQLVPARFACLGGSHGTQASSAKRWQCSLTASSTISMALRNCSPCKSSSTVRLMRERRFGYFGAHAVEAFFQQQRIVDRRWASPEVILPSALIMPVASSAFCSSVNIP